MEQARIVVVSDDREFVNSILQSWQRLHFSPEFAVTGSKSPGAAGRCAVLLADGISALPGAGAGASLAIAISDEALPEAAEGMRAVRIPRGVGWADQAALLVQETVLRLEAQAQLAEMKERLRELERFAALGRFIVEARHGLGNALTGVMGNSELLLLEAGAGMRSEARSQLETIHAMSLKMHETFHQLSSLEIELRMAERQAERETGRSPAH